MECRQLSGFPLQSLPPVSLLGPTAVLLDPSFPRYVSSHATSEVQPGRPTGPAAAGPADCVQISPLQQPNVPWPLADSLPGNRDGGAVTASGALDVMGWGRVSDPDACEHVSASAAEAGGLFSLPSPPPSSSLLLEFPGGRAGLSLLLSVAGLFHVARPVPVPGLWGEWSRFTVRTMASCAHQAAWMRLPAFVSTRDPGTSNWLASRGICSKSSNVHPTPGRCKVRFTTIRTNSGVCQVKALHNIASFIIRKKMFVTA